MKFFKHVGASNIKLLLLFSKAVAVAFLRAAHLPQLSLWFALSKNKVKFCEKVQNKC